MRDIIYTGLLGLGTFIGAITVGLIVDLSAPREEKSDIIRDVT